MNIKPKGKCQKHNVGKLEYARGFFDGTEYSCPVCNKIRGAKATIRDEKESQKREVAYLRKQIQEVKKRYEDRLTRLKVHLDMLQRQPQMVFDKEIEHRVKFIEEHR